jgi:ABC-2 type transport system ATP-binding protein
LDSIQQTYGSDTVRVRLEENGAISWDGLPGVSRVMNFGRTQELRLERGADSQLVLAALMARGTVRHFELSHPSLHDIFVRIAAPAEQDAKDEGATEENEENHHA